MRASTIPLLDNEPLVVIRASFLALCDGDHCAAALLNNFVYWHDWCVTHGRYDSVAAPADPDHQLADPERWFWKTTEGLVNDDLLKLWGEKKVRAAAERLERKGYAQSRFNPKDPYDRTKQYRLIPDRLTADLQAWATQDGRQPVRSSERPSRSGENAECTHSATYSDTPIRQKCRMHTAEGPDVRTETTHSETTKGVDPSSSSSSERVAEPEMTRTEDGRPSASKQLAQIEQAAPSADESGTAALIVEWASERHVRRRRDDRSYGGPDPHWTAQWALYCEERGICDRESVFQVLDAARSAADSREQWRFWKYLDEQVQHAVERYVAPAAPATATPQPVFMRPVEDPSSEWVRVKQILAGRITPEGFTNWVEPTCQVGSDGPRIRVWVPDEITRDWLENEYASQVSDALAAVGGTIVQYTHETEGRENPDVNVLSRATPALRRSA